VRAAEWYCDADVIGLGQTLARVKLPVTWPGDDGRRGHPRLDQEPSPITDPAMPDELWIPEVTRAGLAILTRDSKIMHRVAEIDAVVATGARMFVISGRPPMDLWEELRVVAAQWPRMLERRRDDGPFIDSISLTTTRRLVPIRDREPAGGPPGGS